MFVVFVLRKQQVNTLVEQLSVVNDFDQF